MAVEPDLNSEVYREFDVRVVDNEERYFCLLPPCVDKNKSLSNRQHWITHRKFVHKEKDNINLPSGRVIRKWLTERAGYQPLGRVTASVDRRMISAPSIEEGNTKTYNLVVHISGLMTQLGSAWEELARVVQDTNQCKCFSGREGHACGFGVCGVVVEGGRWTSRTWKASDACEL